VKKQFDLPNELGELLFRIETRYLELKQGRYEKMMHDYLANLHWGNALHTFSSKDETFEGTIRGIDDIGRLKVETTNGVRIFAAKEVEYLR